MQVNRLSKKKKKGQGLGPICQIRWRQIWMQACSRF